jgi:hypothetical protein
MARITSLHAFWLAVLAAATLFMVLTLMWRWQ